MFCEQCGAELEPDARFCDRCGLQVRKEGSRASVATVSRSGTERGLRLLQIGVGGAVLAVVVLGGALLWKGDPKNGGEVAVTGGSGGIIAPVPDGSLSREKAKELIQKEIDSTPANVYDGSGPQELIQLRYVPGGKEHVYARLEKEGYLEPSTRRSQKFRPTKKIMPFVIQNMGWEFYVTLIGRIL